MPNEDFHAIIIDGANEEEREAIHEAVKASTEWWWHRFSDTWIVRGGTAEEWRDRITPLLQTGPSSVLVLSLPPLAQRRWSYYGPNAKERGEWLHKAYTLDAKKD